MASSSSSSTTFVAPIATGSVNISIHGKDVLQLNNVEHGGGGRGEGDFPMNKSEPTYSQSTEEKYSADYTGKHDHGPFLHGQERGSPHERTLRFVEWAREQCATFLNTMTTTEKDIGKKQM